MSQILRLEYTCTKAELDEAQDLNLRKQIGGGSRWRTQLALFGMLGIMLLTLCLMIRREVPRAYWPHAGLAVVALYVILLAWQRRSSKGPPVVNTIEISESDLAILTSASKVVMPWSAFSSCLESLNLFVLVDRPKGTLIVLPKRAFPSENWQTWFRGKATNLPSAAEALAMPAPVLTPSTSGRPIKLTFKVGLRDYLDRALASWRTWGIILFMATLMIGSTLYSTGNPPPKPVHSTTYVLVVFVLPFLFVMAIVVLLVATVAAWRAHAKYLIPQEVALSEECLDFATADASGSVPWTSYTRYKETRASFILWNTGNGQWFMLPKRSFPASEDIDRCRSFLARHLQKSRWFFG